MLIVKQVARLVGSALPKQDTTALKRLHRSLDGVGKSLFALETAMKSKIMVTPGEQKVIQEIINARIADLQGLLLKAGA